MLGKEIRALGEELMGGEMVDKGTVPAPPDLEAQLLAMFMSMEAPPSDDIIHNFAEKINVATDEVESAIYKVLWEWLRITGKHQNVPDDRFNPMELARGIEIEKEHSDNPMIQKAISKDHLAEIPDYYTRLDQLEMEGLAAQGIEDTERDKRLIKAEPTEEAKKNEIQAKINLATQQLNKEKDPKRKADLNYRIRLLRAELTNPNND